MQCPKCQSTCSDDAHFCSHCGARLAGGPHRDGIRWGLIGGVVLCAGIAALILWALSGMGLFPSPTPPPDDGMPGFSSPAPSSDATSRRPTRPPETARAADGFKPFYGRVVLRDITGAMLLQTPVLIVAGGWVALPAAAVAGAHDWVLWLDDETAFPIEGGVLFDSDDIGLWRISGDFSIPGSRLAAWQADQPVAWRPLAGGAGQTAALQTAGCVRQGHFLKCALGDVQNQAGILVQAGRIVGWTFEEGGNHAYLWYGLDSELLQPEFQVADHYRLTFAGSREESFLRALALENKSHPATELAEWADGFTRKAVLATLQTPQSIRPERVIGRMRTLTADLMQTGAAAEVAKVCGPHILREAGSLDLLLAVADATFEAYGYIAAVQLVMAVTDDGLPDADRGRAQLTAWHRQIYDRQLADALQPGRLAQAWDSYFLAARFMPEDPAVHLSAVHLALAAGDWRQAETLLDMRSYPGPFRQQAARLADQIADLKAMAGKITIRFTPGARSIPVTAGLGGGVRQQFIIDTGATLVTVPGAAAAALGIAVDGGRARRRVVTAGGVRFAPEIVLPQVEIDGWVVRNVRALVLDLPERPGWGLLGLNYLQGFDAELQSEKGLLLLAPR
ncbi:MAG: aspartyl protease family protein [Desulfobacterales bacterium]